MKNNIDILKDIVNSNRCVGSTTYMLNAAINDPNVIIVCRDNSHARILQGWYWDKVFEKWDSQSVIKKFFLKLVGKKRPIHNEYYPMFVSQYNCVRDTRGRNKRPIVFDISIVN